MLQTKRIYRIALLSSVASAKGENKVAIRRLKHMEDAIIHALRTGAEHVRFDPEVTMTLVNVITTFFGGTVDDMPEFCDQAGIVFMTNVTYRAKSAG